MSDLSDRINSTPLEPRQDRDAGLAGQVVAYVRAYIARHQMKPGDALPGEATIARTVGVSRPVVREASRTLAALGLVDIAPGRAPRVSVMRGGAVRHFFEHALVTGQAGAQHILEVRRGLEISMAAQAAARRDDRAVALLAELSQQMAATLHHFEAYVRFDMQFHRTLAAATNNPFYVELTDACRAAFESSMDIGLRHRFTSAELDRVQSLHEQILEAVRHGDADGAAAAMTRHFDDALAAVYRAVPSPTATRKHNDDA